MARLLIYSQNFHPSIGGVEASTRIMARELSALGQDVTVATATPLPPFEAECRDGFSVLRTRNLGIVARAARSHDVVISRGGLSLRAGLAAALGRKPLICFHEMAGAAPGSDPPPMRPRLTARVRRLLTVRAALHVGVSDAVLRMKSLPRQARSMVLYNPVDDALWTDHPRPFPARRIDIAFVGRITAEKGVFVLADALKKMTSRASLSVCIVGTGPERTALEAALADSGSSVTFTGPLGGDALRAIYAGSKVVVVPSVITEGMGMVCAEALGSGTPVCISNQPPLIEVAGDAGLTHETSDSAGLAANLDACLADGHLWARISANATDRRDRFSMKAYRSALATRLIPEIARIARP